VYTLGEFCRRSSFLFPVKEKEKENFYQLRMMAHEIDVKISVRAEEKNR